MTCIRILNSAVVPVYNSKHERIEGSRVFQVYLGKLKIPISAYQFSIVHKVFSMSDFHISSTNHKRKQVRGMEHYS